MREHRSPRQQDEIPEARLMPGLRRGIFTPEDLLRVQVRVVIDQHATVALAVDWEGRQATGSAKREPGDARDPETGALLAASRALAALADRLEQEARARVEKAAGLRRGRPPQPGDPSPRPADGTARPVLAEEEIRAAYGAEAAARHRARVARRQLALSLGAYVKAPVTVESVQEAPVLQPPDYLSSPAREARAKRGAS